MLELENRKGRGTMTERYQVTIHSQMGPREGVLTLCYQGSYVTGSLELVGYVNMVQGVRAADGTLYLFHPIQTVVSTIPCETVLQLQAGSLYGTSTSKSARMQWEGTLIHREPQEEFEL